MAASPILLREKPPVLVALSHKVTMARSITCRLLLFLRYPRLGKTKTRLMPIGAAGAGTLQRHMVQYLVQQLKHPNWDLQVHFLGASLAEVQVFRGSYLLLLLTNLDLAYTP